MTDCTHTDAAYFIIDEIKEWCENQTNSFGIMIPADDWEHYDKDSLVKLLGGWLRDHCAALGHKSNPELQALADLVPGLVKALENSLGWMRRWNEQIDEVPSEVARDMHQSQQILAEAREKLEDSDGKNV